MIQTEVTNGDMMIGVLRNIVYNKHEEERVREVAEFILQKPIERMPVLMMLCEAIFMKSPAYLLIMGNKVLKKLEKEAD